MSDVRILQGDCRTLLQTLPAESVHCCVSSSPYWGLRDYGVQGQLGLEPTVHEYVDRIVEVFQEVWRLLRPDGTLWLNMGDCYATGAGLVGEHPGGGERGARWKGYRGTHTAANSGKAGPRIQAVGPMTRPNRMPQPGLKPKDLIGLPWRVAFALQDAGWWLRSDIVWVKPNPMPESVKDRPTRAHEYIFLLAKNRSYYYDAAAISELVDGRSHSRGRGVNPKAAKIPGGWQTGPGPHNSRAGRHRPRPKQNASWSSTVRELVKRRNKRDVWTVSCQPYPDAHFATFPEKLIEPCILAGSPEGGTILDPFSGSGTTLSVALKHNRNAIGVEISPDYIELIEKRLAQTQVSLPLDVQSA